MILGLPWWAWALIIVGLALFVPLKMYFVKKFLAKKPESPEDEES